MSDEFAWRERALTAEGELRLARTALRDTEIERDRYREALSTVASMRTRTSSVAEQMQARARKALLTEEES